ncbi:hypothetical protein JCM5353_002311 [Sporobolomyces roseus]
MDGLIDIQFTQSFINYAKRTTSQSQDLFSIKYQSSRPPPNQIGTIWSTPSTSIHASFPSTSSSHSSTFTSHSSPPPSSSSTTPDLILLLSSSENPTWQLSPLPRDSQLTLKPDTSTSFPPTPRVPTQEELGKKQREFFNDGLGAFNPFKLPNHNHSTEQREDTVMKDVRGERGTERVKEAEVEDFGSFSFSSDTKMQEVVVVNNSQPPSNSLMLPLKPKSKPTPPPLPSPSLPSSSTPLALPSLASTAPPIPRPQFSSKIPASSSTKPSSVIIPNNKESNDSSSDEEDEDDEDFEDVSIPTPSSSSIPQPPRKLETAPRSKQPIPSLLPPTNQPSPNPSSSSSSRRPPPPSSSSLRSIVHPPSSPAPTSTLPKPTLPSSTKPSSAALPPIKTRKPSLEADQASSDSSSSSSEGSESDSDSMDENKLEATINASLGGGRGKKAAMSSGGKGQRLTTTSTAAVSASARPTISRKGLAPPLGVSLASTPSSNQNAAPSLQRTGSSQLSAYDQQRLAMYGHVRATSSGGVGGGVGMVPDLGESDEDEDEGESGSDSD